MVLDGSAVTGTAMREYDPYAYEMHENPYPTYAHLREHAPVYRNERLGFWALSRHADVLTGFRDITRFSNRNGVSLDPASSHPRAHAMMSFLAMDPPRHTRMRALVSRGFTPRRIAELEPRIREIANGHIDAFIEVGRCDFIRDFAGKFPMDVISEMLGVPQADRDQLRAWADTVVHREEGMTDVPPAGMEAAMHMLGYFGGLVADHRTREHNDLTSALLAAEIDGDRLDDVEVLGFLFLMIIAGNETTTKLLGNAVYWLDHNPDQRGLVRDDPTLIPRWVEETLRYDGSTQALARTVTGDVELHGTTMRDGDRVVLLVGAANRDHRVFPEPERYDILRDTTGMLSFGQGTHFCLGAALARLEARVALEEVQRRFPDFAVEPAGIARVHSVNVRGFAALPVAFPPGRREDA
jgi:cytochrome P450